MKLEEATAVLRPRSAWEAVDLGCAMARRHYGKLIRGWLTVALPLWAIICVLLRNHPWWACLLIFWTKPLLTRQPVFFMSRALFGQPPCRAEFWKNWRITFRGMIAALTVKRFAFQRSFRLPVILLEGQRDKYFKQRADVLSAHGGGSAAGLTFIALFLQIAVICALLFCIIQVVLAGAPEWLSSVGYELLDTGSMPDSLVWSLNGALMASTAFIEPFYGAAGFALYINSRTHLEGWDIEVAFRRMSARLLPASVVAVLAVLFLLPAGNARAQDTSDAKAAVQEILKGEDFDVRTERVPKPRELKLDSDIKIPDLPSVPVGGLGFIGYAIIAAAVVVVVWLIVTNMGTLRRGRSSGGEVRAGPRIVMGMDLAPESLPEDIPQAAWRLYQAGQPLDALRLLYRGSLAWLVNRAGLPVHESDTEGDCLRHSEHLPDTPRVSFFSSLTAAWINCAYADVPPAQEPMKQLCEHWPFSMRQRAAAPPTAAVALLLLPFAALLMSSCSKEKPVVEYEEKVIGYKNAAKLNPWLAAEQLLTRMGTPAETRTALTTLPDTGTALFLPADSIVSRGEARRMIVWAATGGHLIVACSGTGRFRNDHKGTPEADLDRESPFFRELGIAPSDSTPESDCEVEIEGATWKLDCTDRVALDLRNRYADVLAGEHDEAVIATFSHGIGRITLLAGATPFRNLQIANQDHAAALCALVALQPAEAVIFISRSEVSLWDMLREYAWMPLLATALLIIFWLWRHLPRFGRAVPADDSAIRHFGTQLDEAGHFLSERAGPGALLAAARRAVLHAAAQRGLRHDAPDFMDQLAARSALTHSEISTALLDDTEKNLIPAAAALQKLQLSLGTSA